MRAAADVTPRPDAVTLALTGTGCTVVGTIGGGAAEVAGTLDPAVVMALLAMAVQAARCGPLTSLTRRVLCLCCVTTLAPDGRIAMVGLTVAALTSLRQGTSAPSRTLGLLWLATAWHVLWARIAFKLVSDRVIAVETPLVADVGRVLLPGLRTEGTVISNGGWFVHVVEGCSAFHGISLALLACVAAATLTGSRIDGRTWAGFGAACVAVVALNVARIVAMLPSRTAYDYWHVGTGGLVAVALTAALGVAPVLLRDVRR